jgi:putative hydrolase of the HAD superfamily
MIRAVFFDVGNTLIRPFPSVGEIYSRIASRHAMMLDAAAVNASFKQAFLLHTTSALTDEKYEKQWWKSLVWETIHPLCSVKNFDSFFDELFEYFIRAEAWEIYTDVRPSLNMLTTKGITLGIISNWDSRLIPLLENLKLIEYFQVLAVSVFVGCAKPDPAIFSYALQKANITPAEVLHVGDSLELDIKGAMRCGIHPLRIDRKDQSSDKSTCPVIHSLDGILSYL